MDFEQELKRVAGIYEKQGYRVTIRPGSDDLPDFAKDFKVEILAKRGDTASLVSVRKNLGEVSADPDMARYAEITADKPGWRFDFVIVEAQGPTAGDAGEAAEPTDEQLQLMVLQRAEESRKIGVKDAGVILLWGPLEAAMRRCAQQLGDGRETQPRVLLSTLYSAGKLSRKEFETLGLAWKIRTALVHGFLAPPFDVSVTELMIDVTKRLIEESKSAQPATA
jgi:hypothetical protein